MSHAASHPSVALAPENITLAPSRVGPLSMGLLAGGAAGLAVTVFGGLGNPQHAMGAALMGLIIILSLSLGSLFFVMAFHLTAAGWSVTIRRQLENMMMMLPVCFGFFAVFAGIEIFSGGILMSWLSPPVAEADAYLLHHKEAFLNTPWLIGRTLLYFGIWTYLARRMWNFSREQDRTGDKWLTNKARFHSSYGMLMFALSVAFFSFDWLKALADFRFFSTMWGVYFFAGSIFATVPALVIILALLKRAGVLKDAVNEEHLHDLGKFCFAFTVFWGYIAFSQYFLIWYSNIPEETAFYVARRNPPWEGLTIALCIGHFILPFFILLWRQVRRSATLLALVGVYMLAMHILDIYWIIRPAIAFVPGSGHEQVMPTIWLDAAGVIGVVGIYAGLLARQITKSPLVPLNDPRMGEALAHKNYV